MIMEFMMQMIPPTVTHQEKQVTVRHGKPVFYEPAELRDARAKLMAHLGTHRPSNPYTGPVELVAVWFFPSSQGHANGTYRSIRPDLDNMQKLLKDCMTDTGYWLDDCLVVREISEKKWSDHPGIYIRVTDVEVADAAL